MKYLTILLFVTLIGSIANAQNPVIVDTAEANAIINQCAQRFPKFYREFQYVKTNDALIKRFVFVNSNSPGTGPAFANPNGTIRINISFLQKEYPLLMTIALLLFYTTR